MNAPKKTASIWRCDRCRRKEVALGRPTQLKCSACGQLATYVKLVDQPSQGRDPWPFRKRAI